MKKHFFILGGFLMINIFAFSQSWTQKTSLFNYGRYCAIGCAANGKGYVGMGQIADGIFLDDFWEYDPSLNQWTSKTSFPGGGRYSAAAYSIKGKIYVCFGYDNSHNCRNDIWEYNPLNNSWVEKAVFPGQARYGASGFVIGDSVLYIGTGSYNEQNNYFYDFWMYNPATNSWIQKSNFPGYNRSHASSFSINGIGYLGSGLSDAVIATQDFWKYNPVNDSWSAIQNLPGEKTGLVSFTISGKGYVGSGCSSYPYINSSDFFEYDPVANTWISATPPNEAISRRAGIGFSVDNIGYFGTGYSDDGLFSDFWAFNKINSGINKIGNNVDFRIYPNPASDKIVLDFIKVSHLQNVTVSIYDLQGQLLMRQPIQKDKTEISINQMEKGLYIVKICLDKDIMVGRFVKE
jgi:N-acetylneuraminic acid mutarotase